MVDVAGYGFKVWETVTTEPLTGADLNILGNYISDLLNKKITAAQISDDAISRAAIVDAAVGDSKLDYSTDGGCRVLKIGHDSTTTGSAMMIWGTSLLTAANTTNTTVTIIFSNAALCTAGDPAYTATPVVGAYVITADTDVAVQPTSVNTLQMEVYVDASASETFTENWVVYWWAVGDR